MRCLFLFCSCLAFAGDWDYTVNSDSFISYEDQDLFPQGNTGVTTRLRLNGTYDFGEVWQWEGAYEVQGRRRKDLAPLIFTRAPLRVDDFDLVLEDGENQDFLHRLDRFRLTYDRDSWRITLGRQAIGHGNGRFFTPSDLFAPLSPFSLNTQYKAGVDGIRVTRALPKLWEVELFVLFPEDEDTFALTHVSGTVGNLDVSLLAGMTYGEFSLAWDFAGTLAGAAVYSEGVWRDGKDRDSPLRTSAGLSRRFGTKTDVTFEAYYQSLMLPNLNGFLSEVPNLPIDLAPDSELLFQLLAALYPPEWRHGELYQLNRFHLAGSLSYEVHPLARLSGSIQMETEDQSARYQLGLEWDVSDRAAFSSGVLATSGDESSEYGAAGTAIYGAENDLPLIKPGLGILTFFQHL